MQEMAQIQKIDNDNTDPLVLDQLQCHDKVIILVFDTVILVEASALIELHQAQYTLNYMNNEEVWTSFLFFHKNSLSFFF